ADNKKSHYFVRINHCRRSRQPWKWFKFYDRIYNTLWLRTIAPDAFFISSVVSPVSEKIGYKKPEP
ncbi:MAG: hypothetical protein FWC50_10310, partial [Planctomycetaceae bacterium]|nr:hypothetical protein [Planctomycetaceae bacterium]